MLKTGNVFIDFFSKGIILLPLLPAGIIFLRRIYRQPALNFLFILCLLNFSECLGLLLPGLSSLSHAAFKNIFFLLEVVVLVQIIGSWQDLLLKSFLNGFLIAFLSAFTTYFALEGIDNNSLGLDYLQHAIFLLLALPVMIIMIRENSLYIFRLPLFWITSGTLFYFSIIILMEWVSRCYLELPGTMNSGRVALMDIASLVRYLLYALAAINYEPSMKKE